MSSQDYSKPDLWKVADAFYFIHCKNNGIEYRSSDILSVTDVATGETAYGADEVRVGRTNTEEEVG